MALTKGLLVAASNQFGQMFRGRYDIHDDLVEVTDANGVTVTNAYERSHHLVSRQVQGGVKETWSHGTAGMLLKHIDGYGMTNGYRYDVAGRRIAETNALLGVTQFSAVDSLVAKAMS